MDGKGRWLDNVFIERLWRSLKCEDIYLKDYRNLVELEAGVEDWISAYNHRRIHQALGLSAPLGTLPTGLRACRGGVKR